MEEEEDGRSHSRRSAEFPACITQHVPSFFNLFTYFSMMLLHAYLIPFAADLNYVYVEKINKYFL